ncbi:hypothetical protein [Thermococcus sp.]|uniref:hypothetical protein n=1 Tax=Thermococcus sp. TaxID=35749 RepID=UPI0026081DE3|nr:hypothetical protein [Thermococcus sp.]
MLSQRKKKLLTATLTIGITAYLIYRVYSEASKIEIRSSQLLSPYLFLALLLGIAGYLIYTTLWHIYLTHLVDVEFKRVLLANLSGTYLSFSFNAAIGTLIKVKFIGASYFQVLATNLAGVATELMVGSAMLVFLMHDWGALLTFLFFLLTFIADNRVYHVLVPVLSRIRAGGISEEFYAGWHAARSRADRVLAALILGALLILINAGVLMSVGMAFGISIPLGDAIKAILYSTVLGSVLGTPGGIGGNELGVLMAIGNTGLNVLIAFTFKFLNQYLFALVGAVAFYRSVLTEVGVKDLTDEGKGKLDESHERSPEGSGEENKEAGSRA